MAGNEGPLGREEGERAWSDGGWLGAVRAWIEAASSRRDVNPAIIAMVSAQIGEVDQAFSWLERAYQARGPAIQDLKLPFFDLLHADPRYEDLLRRIGFPEELLAPPERCLR